jgi:hypothetical protein
MGRAAWASKARQVPSLRGYSGIHGAVSQTPVIEF